MLDIVLSYLNLMYTMWVRVGRGNLVSQFAFSNCVTGEVFTPDPHKDLSLQVIELMALTAEQRERIAQGHAVLNRLLKPVMQEHIQLQQQLARKGLATADQRLAAASLPASMRQPGAADHLQEQHQQQLQRLQLVMKKGVLLELCAAAFTLGCLNLRQVCQATGRAVPACHRHEPIGHVHLRAVQR